VLFCETETKNQMIGDQLAHSTRYLTGLGWFLNAEDLTKISLNYIKFSYFTSKYSDENAIP